MWKVQISILYDIERGVYLDQTLMPKQDGQLRLKLFYYII